MTRDEFRKFIHDRERAQFEAGVRVGMAVGFATAILATLLLGLMAAGVWR